MNEPVKTGTCLGCRARSFIACMHCSYMMEGIAAQENVEALTGPIELGGEVSDADSAHEQECTGASRDTGSIVPEAI